MAGQDPTCRPATRRPISLAGNLQRSERAAVPEAIGCDRGAVIVADDQELIDQELIDLRRLEPYRRLNLDPLRMSGCVRSVLGRPGGVVLQMGRYWFQSRMFMRANGAICRARV